MKLKFLIWLMVFNFTFSQVKQDALPVNQEVLEKELDSAFSLTFLSDYTKAISKAKYVLEEANETNISLQARAYKILGISFSEISPKDGLPYFEKSLEMFLKVNDTANILASYNNIAVINKIIGNLDITGTFLEKGLNFSENPENYNSSPSLHYNYANYLNVIDEDSSKVFSYLKKATKLVEKFNQSSYGEIYKIYGETYLKYGDIKKSKQYFQNALEKYKQINYLTGQKEIYYLNAKLFKQTKDFLKSNENLNAYLKINDSINENKRLAVEKKVNAEYAIKERQQYLKSLLKQKSSEKSLLNKTKAFNIALTVLCLFLLLIANIIYKKNKEFKIAKTEAEKLSAVKSKFYSQISHELRTPLYAVIELSSILLKEQKNSKQIDYLRSLHFSGNHLLALIDNVLQINEEHTDINLQYVEVNLKQLATSVIDSLEFALRNNNNTIELKYDSSIPENLIGDPLKVTQVLINLVSNAIKFTTNGHVKIKISHLKTENNFTSLNFKIKDTGKGLSEEAQKLIFQDFYQDSSSKNKNYKGTGLGLSIVKRILQTMNSEIKISSVLGKGTTFYFDIDFKNKESVKNIEERFESKIKAIEGSRFLIIDDNKVNQMVTKKVLDQFQFESDVASSGYEGIDKLKQSHFDCILMDLHMPEIDGYETTDKIREFNKQIPIVALTAASVEEVENNIYNHDMNGYVLKPFITSNFINVIAKAINKNVAV